MIAAVKMSNDLDKKLEIKAEAEHLALGNTSNDIKCPWCGKNKSFSVTKTLLGDLLYLCHRANCGEAGYIRDRSRNGGFRSSPQPRKQFTPRIFDYPTTRLAGTVLSKLVETYGLSVDEIYWAEWCYSFKNDRLAMPVLSPAASYRGFVTKTLNGLDIPKNLNYKEVDGNWMGWYLRDHVALADAEGKYSTVIVVEDLVSCLKASRFYPAVAILGTYINWDMLKEMLELSKNVVLCLDADATQKAYDYAAQFAAYGNFRTVPLSKDIKDMTKEELSDWSERL